MKKAGILTFHTPDNYGAVLQAYALQSVILDTGIDVEIIDAKPETSIPEIISVNGLLNTDTYRYIKRSFRAKNRRTVESSTKKSLKFKSFREKFYNLSSLKVSKVSGLKGYSDYVVGSDQVWNSSGVYGGAFYFLNTKLDGRKISYAASFGRDTIPSSEQKLIKKWVSKFDAISVREDSAVALIKENIPNSVSHVLDPTLLLTADKWSGIEQIVDGVEANEYVLVYALGQDELLLEIADRVAKKNNLKKVIFINQEEFGPEEFLWLFRNAFFVVTTSFHGTAFSINYRKNFICVPHITRGTRMISLLKLLCLENVIVYEVNDLDDMKMESTDYTASEALIERERKNSIRFLKDALLNE